jgi:hypothetical protein
MPRPDRLHSRAIVQRMRPTWLLLVGVIIAALAGSVLLTACSGAASIDERNAAASPAVAYESGADFVEALNRAGVACPNPTISPVTTPALGETIHVADSVSSTYAKDDVVNVFVAWPSEPSSKYFSKYFESSQEARASVSAQGMTLKGELWFARASDDQRLFDIQEALGGQLIKP